MRFYRETRRSERAEGNVGLTFPSWASFISIITPRREPVSLSITTPV